MNTDRFCRCKACKRAARKGKVLGSRTMGFFYDGIFGFCSVSDYVPFRKFAKGRARPEARFNFDNEFAL